MVRLPRDLTDRIDAIRGGVPRDRWLRNLVSDALAARGPAPIPGQATIDDALSAPAPPSIAPAPTVSGRGPGRRAGGARSQPRASSAGEAGVSEPGRGGGADPPIDPAARDSHGCPECGGTVADGACGDCGWKAEA
jgi:hypothetical protein